jgi:ribosome-binding factor A
MTQRTEKVASLIKQIVATELAARLRTPEVTVTAVDVSPDLRQATIWLGLLDSSSDLLERVVAERPGIQSAVARQLTTKFVPRLHFKADSGGEYADHISRLIRDL